MRAREKREEGKGRGKETGRKGGWFDLSP